MGSHQHAVGINPNFLIHSFHLLSLETINEQREFRVSYALRSFSEGGRDLN